MTALMGPSGAGKTVLLESLINKRTKGLSGEISLHTSGWQTLGIKMAVIPQHDLFFENLTVKETILLSSKLRNEGFSHKRHIETVFEIAKKLTITDCLEERNSQIRCGQRKKLAIATELVTQPNFLVLDECTTGTDSFSAKGIIDFLRDFSERENVAVLCSIHQPSWSIICKFHKLYMLSPVVGKPIFEGDPRNVISYLSTFGFECEGSAVDFITDVAAGKGRGSSADALANLSKMQILAFNEEHINGLRYTQQMPLFQSFSSQSHSWSHYIDIILELWIRDLKSLSRDRLFITTIMFSYLFFAVFYLVMFGFPGKDDGCIPWIDEDSFSKSHDKNSDLFDYLVRKVENSFDETRRNNYLQVFAMVSGVFIITFPIILRLPSLMYVYWKEVKNGHYTPFQLFLGLTLADISFGVTLTTLFALSVFAASTLRYINEDISKRLILFFSNISLQAFYAQSLVFVTSCILYESEDSAIFFGSFAFFIQILFSGLMRVLPQMNDFSAFMSLMTSLRYSSAITYIINYGYSRCGLNPELEAQDRSTKIVNFIQNWALSELKISSSAGRTFFVEENLNLTSVFSDEETKHFLESETKGIIKTLLIRVLKFFVTAEGKMRPIGISFNGFSDEDDVPSMAYLVMWTTYLRLFALLVLIYRLRQRF
jgi:ABC-type multidrug transport system ATPase subunit